MPVGIPPAPVVDTVTVNVTLVPYEVGFADAETATVVASGTTTWVNVFEELARWFVSPPYSARIPWLPVPSPLVMIRATPLPSAAAEPRDVVPSKNVTVPEGVPEPGTEVATVAERVMFWRMADGFDDEPTTVVVDAGDTFWVSTGEVLGRNAPSGDANSAVSAWLPTERFEMVRNACPAEFKVPRPMVVVPSLNVTSPVAAGVDVTDAVSWTD
ncbi:MAG: hypothetical protein U0169_20165 [Polyangiaceae bacterium]